MDLTLREVVTATHGMLFGGFFLMALFAIVIHLLEPSTVSSPSRTETSLLIGMTVFGWAAVLSGTYVVYPWYRAVAPAGADLALYPKFLLTAHPATAGWHNLGMEWKEHVAWIAPMVATMITFVLLRQRAAWSASRQIRRAVTGFAGAAFLAAALAGTWGALISKKAPVQGGRVYQLRSGAR
jgi:hypothetical protein